MYIQHHDPRQERPPEPSFPEGFLFGTATSATQIEGSPLDADWYAFARKTGRIHDGTTPEVACDHWRRLREDIELQRHLGANAHRLSLEWARIEPEEGRFDSAALERYREEIGLLVDAGIEPMVTLHHFTLPGWLARKGGLLARKLPYLMARYAERAAEALGDLVRLWITVNEPNVLVVMGYLFGIWPPAERGRMDRMVLAHHRLLHAHVELYRALHRTLDRKRSDALVGVAHHLGVFEPEEPRSRGDRLLVGLQDRFFNQGFAGALAHGRFFGPLDVALARSTGFSIREAEGTQDFWGVNYYSRDLVRFGLDRRRAPALRTVPEDAERTDLGWEVYPEGLWPRFGLYAVDHKTQERRPRRSAELYARIIRERRIPDGVWGESEARPRPAARRASAR